MKNKIIWLIVAVVVVGGVVWMGKASNRDTTTGVIKVGFVGPLTGDGVAWGEIERNMIQLAIDEINENGGVDGKKIAFFAEDGKCTGKDALSATKKLVEIERIKILFVSCSQEVMAIAPYTEKNKVLVFASFANASSITSAGDYIFRNAYSNLDSAKIMASLSRKYGNTAAIISEQSEFATDLKNLFVKQFESMGGTLVDAEDFKQESRDFRTIVSKIVSKNPAVIVVNPNGPATGLPILKQIRELGYKGILVGNFFGGSSEVQKSSDAQGLIYVSDPVIIESSLKKQVFEKYNNKFGKYPDLEWPATARYDAVYILKQALDAVGDDPTKIKDHLYNMSDFSGILGTYQFDENGDMTNAKPAVAVIKNYKASIFSE